MYTIILLALFVAMPAPYAFAADDATKWKEWGSSPFAYSREEACKKAVVAITGFSMPEPVKDHFKTVLKDTRECLSGGKEVWLVPNMRLQEMWSGPNRKNKSPHVMKNKIVAELPVTKSPEGRAYRKDAVAEAARASSWEFVYEGKKYTLYLPFVCFNWSWADEVVSQAEQCYTITIPLKASQWKAEKVYWGVATVDGIPLPPSACNAQKTDPGGEWVAWHGICEECERSNHSDLKNFLGDSIGVPHKFVYPPVTSAKLVTLRFPAAVRRSVVYVCLAGQDDTEKSCGVYVRPDDWTEGRTQIEISPSLFVWDTTQCSTQE